MTDDEIIDAVLKLTFPVKQNAIKEVYNSCLPNNPNGFIKFLPLLAHFDLVNSNDYSEYDLSYNGKAIKKSGGWLSHIENLRKQSQIQSLKTDLEIKNLKWTYEKRKWPFWISGISLLVSIFAAIIAVLTLVKC